MGNENRSTDVRLIPEIPISGQRMRLLFDTDAGAEIDDLYAISLALASPDRFEEVTCRRYRNIWFKRIKLFCLL